jgi:hypothetical protein
MPLSTRESELLAFHLPYITSPPVHRGALWDHLLPFSPHPFDGVENRTGWNMHPWDTGHSHHRALREGDRPG